MAVAALMMRLPDKDVDPLPRLAYASLAPHGPRYGSGSEEATVVMAHYDITKYFSAYIAKRRECRSTDLISQLLSVNVDGRLLTDEKILLNCLSLLLGAVVTTSHAINATLIALAEQNGGEGRWPDAVPVRAAVEEALR